MKKCLLIANYPKLNKFYTCDGVNKTCLAVTYLNWLLEALNYLIMLTTNHEMRLGTCSAIHAMSLSLFIDIDLDLLVLLTDVHSKLSRNVILTVHTDPHGLPLLVQLHHNFTVGCILMTRTKQHEWNACKTVHANVWYTTHGQSMR